MKKSEEIELLSAMIANTEKALMKDPKDRLQLEHELIQLRKELSILCSPTKNPNQKTKHHEEE